MNVMTNSTQQGTVEKPVYGGEFLARCEDGSLIFLPFVAAGEKVRFRIEESRSHFKRGVPLEILTPSPDRVKPLCQHFGTCGGCHYQHLSYQSQWKVKEAVLIEQLTRLGRIPNPPIHGIVPSPQPWNYRNVMQFHISKEGWPGLASASSNTLVRIKECHLPEIPIAKLCPHLMFPEEWSGSRLEIRVDSDRMPRILSNTNAIPPAAGYLDQDSEPMLKNVGGILSAQNHQPFIYSINDQTFVVQAGAFFQVNIPQAEAMVDHVLDLAQEKGLSLVYDVYCGVGLFSKFLAPLAAKVIGIERSKLACESFRINTADFPNVHLKKGRAEDLLPVLAGHPDLVILDPPRSGLSAPVQKALIKSSPGEIIYVSCNPSTLARDLAFLTQQSYQVTQITPFDLFPQTFHIESISQLKKK
jgi:23S rRNA (uracil1939-C5)-methyltransferase